MFLWKVFLVLTIIIKYAWVCLNKQDSEFASGPKYVKILNMAKFWIWQRSQFSSVTQGSEYARIYLDRVLITVLYPAVLGGGLIHTLKFTKAPPWLALKEKKSKFVPPDAIKMLFPALYILKFLKRHFPSYLNLHCKTLLFVDDFFKNFCINIAFK